MGERLVLSSVIFELNADLQLLLLLLGVELLSGGPAGDGMLSIPKVVLGACFDFRVALLMQLQCSQPSAEVPLLKSPALGNLLVSTVI